MPRTPVTTLHAWIRHAVTLAVAGVSCMATGQSIAISTAKDVHEMAQLCMYVQRVFKDYAMVGMGVTYHDPAKDLAAGIDTIDRFLADMESHHITPQLDQDVRAIHNGWDAVKAVVGQPPRQQAMGALHHRVEELVKSCETTADHLAEATGTRGEHEVVLLSALGMETQRLAALYMMKAWDTAGPDYPTEVKRITDEYRRIEAELLAADDKLVPPSTKTALKTLEKDFMVLSFMASRTSGRTVPTLMEKSATRVFDEMQILLQREEKHITRGKP